MDEEFDEAYWESHWQQGHGGPPTGEPPPNLHLVGEVGNLAPGTALDAGCGAGAEAMWLAGRGWRVTAVDISRGVLERAATRAGAVPSAAPILWVAGDLGVWEPEGPFDLVTTHYAHPTIPQLDFYERIAGWVAPGGTLLIVGHRRPPEGARHAHGQGHGHDAPAGPSAHVTVTAADILGRLASDRWDVVTAEASARTLPDTTGRPVALHDVVVRAVRRT